jgi:type I restriction enzyme S subunit
MEKELPDGWEWVNFGDVFNIIYRYPSYYGIEYIENGVPEIRGELLLEGGAVERDFSKYRFISEDTSSNFPKTVLKEGDIVMSVRGTIGKIGLIPSWLDGSNITANLIRLSPNSEIITGAFLKYLMRTERFKQELNRCSPSTTIKTIKVPSLSSIQIPLPPLDTQHQIVIILEKAEETKKLRAQADELTQQLLQSVFLEMFGDPVSNPKHWNIKSFNHFAKIDTNMTKDFTKYGNYPHIGIENIERNTGNLIDYKKVNDQKLTSGKYIFSKNHIIYSKIRPNLNKVALPTFDGLCSADSYPLLVNDKHTNRYFFTYILRSNYFLNYILKLSDRTNIPKVNKKQLESFSCICPPIEIQRDFAEIVQQVGKTKHLQQQSSSEIDTLFNSLMQKAFNGELVAE